MTTSVSRPAPSGGRLFAAAVVGLVLLGASGMGWLQATSDGTWGEGFWLVVGAIAVVVVACVAAVAISNLARRRMTVVSVAALLVAAVPAALLAVVAAPTLG